VAPTPYCHFIGSGRLFGGVVAVPKARWRTLIFSGAKVHRPAFFVNRKPETMGVFVLVRMTIL